MGDLRLTIHVCLRSTFACARVPAYLQRVFVETTLYCVVLRCMARVQVSQRLWLSEQASQ
jgi:hypothetical protein